MIGKKNIPSSLGTALTREYTIQNKFGMHARPAALFVKEASKFDSEITIEKEGNCVSGKSIMGLLTMELHHGARVRISADGADAEEALDALGHLIDRKFYED